MRDGQQDKQGMRDGEGEREGMESHEGEEESRGQKRSREDGAAEAEDDGTNTPAHEDTTVLRNKRTRTAEGSPSLTSLHDSPSNALQPTDSLHQETTLTSVTNADADTLPLLTPPIGRPESAEERKARQREANRLAAGRSRGKKRDEL
jgi:hypothetical protein